MLSQELQLSRLSLDAQPLEMISVRAMLLQLGIRFIQISENVETSTLWVFSSRAEALMIIGILAHFNPQKLERLQTETHFDVFCTISSPNKSDQDVLQVIRSLQADYRQHVFYGQSDATLRFNGSIFDEVLQHLIENDILIDEVQVSLHENDEEDEEFAVFSANYVDDFAFLDDDDPLAENTLPNSA